MMLAAMGMFESDALSARNTNLLMIFIGLVAFAMLVLAIVAIVLAVVTTKAVKKVMVTVDELKGKALPIMHTAAEIGTKAQLLITETSPKVRVITDNLLEISHTARGMVAQGERTFTDANARTQKQVVRVDGMVTAVLTTTAEITESLNNGIRVPAHKIAVMVTEGRIILEGLLEKAKGFSSHLPFGFGKAKPVHPVPSENLRGERW